MISMFIFLSLTAKVHQIPAKLTLTPRLVYTLDLRNVTDYDERCLFASAEGLINSKKDSSTKVYLIWRDVDLLWLPWLVKHHYIEKVLPLKEPETLLEMTETSRAVVYDESPYQLPDIATTVAGCEHALMVGNPSLLGKYDLKNSVDLRSKFKTNAEAYGWLINHYRLEMNHQIVSITVPVKTATHNPANLRDILVGDKIFTFWTTGSNETALPGADASLEKKIIGDYLRAGYQASTMCLGYPWSGDGFGPSETDGVTFLSENAKWLVATDNFSNLSFWTCFPPSTKKLPVSPKTPKYSKDQKYASIVMSDGDNACTFQDFFPDYWNKFSSNFPVGWTVAPTLRTLAPPIYDYTCAHLPKGSTAGTGVSGIGYMSMESWAKNYGPNQQNVENIFLAQTANICELTGEKWLWIMRYGPPKGDGIKAYATQVPGISAIMGGYGTATDDPTKSVETYGKVGVFHSFIPGNNLEELELNITKALADKNCPQFLNIFTQNWSFPPAKLEALGSFLEKNHIKILTPEQLGNLATEARVETEPKNLKKKSKAPHEK